MGWERETWFNKQLVGYKRVEKLGCSGSTFFHMKPGKIRPGGLQSSFREIMGVPNSSYKVGLLPVLGG